MENKSDIKIEENKAMPLNDSVCDTTGLSIEVSF